MSNNNELIIKTNKFLGYGNPCKAKIFFIGIEENGVTSKNDIEKWFKNKIPIGGNTYYYTDVTGRENNNVKGSTETLQAKLAYMLLKDVFKCSDLLNEIDEIEYLKEYYVKKENRVVTMNLYPLSAPNDKTYPDNYSELTGFQDKTTYRNTCWEFERFPREKMFDDFLKFVKNKFSEREKYFIFIMGADPENRIRPILNDLGYIFRDEDKITNLLKSQKKKNYFLKWSWSQCMHIWFTGHPSYGWFDERVAQWIAKYISSMNSY